MFKGDCDIVGNITEFPLASRALQKADISTFASVAQSDTIYLIGRKDHGIKQLSDIKGKKVGSIFGAITDFCIGRLLELNGMNIKDVTLVNVKTPAGSVAAIINGDVDAVVIGQPYASSVRDQLGANAFFESAQSGQPLYALAVSTNEWLKNQPVIVVKLLKSLSQAEEFLVNHPAEARKIIEKQLNFDEAYLDAVWPQYKFSLSLDQPLILDMEDEARWMISNNMTAGKNVPDSLDYINADALKLIKPDATIAGK